MASPGSAVFFVVFLVVGALFVMNLFLGFIVDGFKSAKGTDQTHIIYARFTRMLSQYRPSNGEHINPQNPLSNAVRSVVQVEPSETHFSTSLSSPSSDQVDRDD